ncbi:ATP synthase subunit I [Paenibacillus aceti]|uniref:ATP synthase subunit I n=1 Tax=Paenibacillus aceti TaxID=1820010 RepID=A0ABQ1VST0_9BACL|nr:ATP synthase subunit I [Paenibacillus aceti]GGF95879.1 hypothetical protein GCM10010913_16870 [Paenibacillus aceti]
MDNLNSIVAVVTRMTFLMLSVLFLGWAFLLDFRPIISGLILGLVGGTVYTRYLSMKVHGLVEFAVSQEKKRFSFGFLTRVCLILLVTMVAVKLEQVSVISAVIGFFIPQLLTIPVGLVLGARSKS